MHAQVVHADILRLETDLAVPDYYPGGDQCVPAPPLRPKKGLEQANPSAPLLRASLKSSGRRAAGVSARRRMQQHAATGWRAPRPCAGLHLCAQHVQSARLRRTRCGRRLCSRWRRWRRWRHSLCFSRISHRECCHSTQGGPNTRSVRMQWATRARKIRTVPVRCHRSVNSATCDKKTASMTIQTHRIIS
jgi:hypothetical protein